MSKNHLEVEEQDDLTDDQIETDEESPESKALARLKESIIVRREDLGGLRVKLTVTVPRETMDERLHEQFAELKKEAAIPGFRKGHAPLKLIEKRFGGEVGEDIKAKLVSSGCLAAVERENLKTLGDPHLWVQTPAERTDFTEEARNQSIEKLLPFEKALDHLSLPKDGPLTFSCEVELKPEFELPELTKLPVERPNVSITDEDVDAELTRLVSWRGTFEPVEGGTVKEHDLLYVDMKMHVDGELVASEENIDVPARDVVVRGVPLQGLGKAIVGKKVGEIANITADVPEDHEQVSARGKKAKFEFTLREIKRWKVPKFDADMLASFGFDSEDELRSKLRTSLEARLQRTIKERMLEQIGEHLIERTSFDIPEGLSQRQAERAVARRSLELLQKGLPPAEVQKLADQMRGKAREQVVKDLKLFFVLEKIAESRKIDVSEGELNGAMAEIARATGKRFDRVRDELNKQDGLMTLYMKLRDEKVLESLLADAEITETAGPQKNAPATEGAKKKTPKSEPSEKTPKTKTTAAPKAASVPKPAAKKKKKPS